MAAIAALLAILGAMFGGALAVDRWRAARLRAWATAGGWAPVDRATDGGALLGHATRFSKRVRSFGLTFHQVAPADEVWLAEHRAALTSGRAERWHTLVVVRLPGATLDLPGGGAPEGWTHGGDVAAGGEFVRWRRQGLLWPWNTDARVAQGRALAALVASRR